MTAFPADAELIYSRALIRNFSRLSPTSHIPATSDASVRRTADGANREYPPLYDVQCGWDAPKTGKAFKILG